jgi:hypothetical protein
MAGHPVIRARLESWCRNCGTYIAPGDLITRAARAWQHADCAPSAYTAAVVLGCCQRCLAAKGAREAKVRRCGAMMYERFLLCPACLGACREAGFECGWAEELAAGTQCVQCGAGITHRGPRNQRLVYCGECRAGLPARAS